MTTFEKPRDSSKGGILCPKIYRNGGSEVMDKTTMSVRELAMQMGISLPKAYELVKTPGFPSIRIGTRILIPIDAFREWLVITSNLED